MWALRSQDVGVSLFKRSIYVRVSDSGQVDVSVGDVCAHIVLCWQTSSRGYLSSSAHFFAGSFFCGSNVHSQGHRDSIEPQANCRRRHSNREKKIGVIVMGWVCLPGRNEADFRLLSGPGLLDYV